MILAGITIVLLIVLLGYQQFEHSRERAILLNRIQAPETVLQREFVERTEPLPTPEPDLGPFEWQAPEEEALNG